MRTRCDSDEIAAIQRGATKVGPVYITACAIGQATERDAGPG